MGVSTRVAIPGNRARRRGYRFLQNLQPLAPYLKPTFTLIAVKLCIRPRHAVQLPNCTGSATTRHGDRIGRACKLLTSQFGHAKITSGAAHARSEQDRVALRSSLVTSTFRPISFRPSTSGAFEFAEHARRPEGHRSRLFPATGAVGVIICKP